MRNNKLVTSLAAIAVIPVILIAGEEYPELPLRISNETAEAKAERMAWWTEGRFGMFIHFGLYSALGRHEWVQNREAIAPDEYERRYMPRFNPDLYDAKAWVAAAKKAGMKYIGKKGKDHAGLYLSEGPTVSGGRHVRISGLDVLSATPEGTALLDGALDYLNKGRAP